MIYLDNSATTKPSPIAVTAAQEAVTIWGNPSSAHKIGLEAKQLLEASRLKIAHTLALPKFAQDKIVFTSSGTEANNIALLGTANAKGKKSLVIISDGEHPSVDNTAMSLEKQGHVVQKIPTIGGKLDLDFLENILKSAPLPLSVISVMLTNNETGATYDVKSAFNLAKSYFPDATAHCDATQAYMKIKFTPAGISADLVTASAHKIHALRGAGMLYVSGNIIKRKNLTPPELGGGQEWGFRSGTENLVSIAAFAAQAEEEYKTFAERAEKIKQLRHSLDIKVESTLAPLGVKQNLPDNRADTILNLTLPKIKSETMLNYLSNNDICVSAGSACSTHAKGKSKALTAFGLKDSEIDCAIRVSIDENNTEEEIAAFVEAVEEGAKSLQRIK